MDEDFPGKVTHCRHVFFIWIAQWSVEEEDTITIKVAKAKEKSATKMEKTAKYAEEQDNDSTYSFQNYDSRQLLMFLYQGWYLHKEKETLFLTSFMANFGLTATSLFEIWTPAWSSDSISRFHIEIFFLFLTEWYSFFLLWPVLFFLLLLFFCFVLFCFFY